MVVSTGMRVRGQFTWRPSASALRPARGMLVRSPLRRPRAGPLASAQQQPQAARGASSSRPPATSVNIRVHKPLSPGSVVKVSGDTECLGAWAHDAAPQLQWHEGDLWSTDMHLPPGDHRFKFAVVPASGAGDVEWEQGEDRRLHVPGDCSSLIVEGVWGNTGDTEGICLLAYPDQPEEGEAGEGGEAAAGDQGPHPAVAPLLTASANGSSGSGGWAHGVPLAQLVGDADVAAGQQPTLAQLEQMRQRLVAPIRDLTQQLAIAAEGVEQLTGEVHRTREQLVVVEARAADQEKEIAAGQAEIADLRAQVSDWRQAAGKWQEEVDSIKQGVLGITGVITKLTSDRLKEAGVQLQPDEEPPQRAAATGGARRSRQAEEGAGTAARAGRRRSTGPGQDGGAGAAAPAAAGEGSDGGAAAKREPRRRSTNDASVAAAAEGAAATGRGRRKTGPPGTAGSTASPDGPAAGAGDAQPAAAAGAPARRRRSTGPPPVAAPAAGAAAPGGQGGKPAGAKQQRAKTAGLAAEARAPSDLDPLLQAPTGHVRLKAMTYMALMDLGLWGPELDGQASPLFYGFRKPGRVWQEYKAVWGDNALKAWRGSVASAADVVGGERAPALAGHLLWCIAALSRHSPAVAARLASNLHAQVLLDDGGRDTDMAWGDGKLCAELWAAIKGASQARTPAARQG